MSNKPFKVTVCFEGREDGGLRAWSPDLPGFVLSHRNVDALLADVEPVLKELLRFQLETDVSVERLESLREALEDSGVVSPHAAPGEKKEYLAYCA